MSRIRLPLVPRPLRYLFVFLAMGIILHFSLRAGVPRPSSPSPFWDKYLHFVAYGGLTLSLAYATATYRDHPYLRAALVVGGAIGFGVLVEFAQGRLPHRQFDVADLLANTLGALLVSVWFVVERRIRYVRARRLVEER